MISAAPVAEPFVPFLIACCFIHLPLTTRRILTTPSSVLQCAERAELPILHLAFLCMSRASRHVSQQVSSCHKPSLPHCCPGRSPPSTNRVLPAAATDICFFLAAGQARRSRMTTSTTLSKPLSPNLALAPAMAASPQPAVRLSQAQLH